MTKIYIIHGWEGTPNEGWFPWIKKRIIEHGCSVEIPQMPNRVTPLLSEWVKVLGGLVNKDPKNTILLAHSLGTATILNYLNKSRGKQKFKAIILVAPLARDVGIVEIKDFVNHDLDWSKIIKRAKQFIVIHSQDDMVIPISEGKYVATKLKAKLIPVNNFGHFCDLDNISIATPILDIIRSVLEI